MTEKKTKKPKPLTPKQIAALQILRRHDRPVVAARVGGLTVCEALVRRGLVKAGPLKRSSMTITSKGTFVNLTASYYITPEGVLALEMASLKAVAEPVVGQ